MRIDLNDPIAIAALNVIQERHKVSNYKELEHIMEKEYKCKIVYEDHYGLSGYMEMPDDKYTTWFLIQFGDGDVKSV